VAAAAADATGKAAAAQSAALAAAATDAQTKADAAEQAAYDAAVAAAAADATGKAAAAQSAAIAAAAADATAKADDAEQAAYDAAVAAAAADATGKAATAQSAAISAAAADATAKADAAQTAAISAAASGAAAIYDGTRLRVIDWTKTGQTTIDGGKIYADSITAAQIAANAITTTELAADSVTSAHIVAGTIVAADIAANTITAAQIAANTITAAQIAADTITASQIAANAITASELATDSVIAAKIQAGAVTAGKLAANSVIAGTIAAGTIVAADIAADTITAAQIAANAITATELAANAVVAGKIAAGTIVAGDIAANTITGAKIAANTITAANIAADTITAAQIAANAITTAELNANAVTAAKIAANTITAAQIAALTITAAEIAGSTITGAKIAANTITAANIAADTITATQIAASAITASELAANAVVAGKIDANAVTAGTIAANAVTTGTVAASAITTDKIAALAVSADKIAANAITAAKIAAGTITATEISSSYVYTGQVTANQITTGDLSATVALVGELTTSASGRRVSLSNLGLRALDGNNDIVASIPTDPTQAIQFQADVIATSLTATGKVAMRDSANELGQGSALFLRQATAAPVTAPTVSVVYDTTIVETTNRDRGYGGSYYATAARTYQAWNRAGLTTESGIWVFDSAGSHVTAEEIAIAKDETEMLLDVVRVGTGLYVLSYVNGKLNFRLYNASTKALVAGPVIVSTASLLFNAPNGDGSPGSDGSNARFSWDGTTLWLVYLTNSFLPRAIKWTGLTGAALPVGSGSEVAINGSPAFPGIGGVAVATLSDIGTPTLFIAPRSGTSIRAYQSLSTIPAYAANYDFPANINARALFYNSTLTCLVGYSWYSGEMTRYNGTSWTTESSTWYITNTWRDSNATGGTHETTQGPAAVITMPKRARLSITTPPIPTSSGTDSVNSVSIYVGRGDGSRTTQWRQSAPADGIRSVTVQAASFAGTNPPSANNFPTATPAIVQSEAVDVNGPLFWVDGAGNGRWKNLITTTPRVLSRQWAWNGGGSSIPNGQEITVFNFGSIAIPTGTEMIQVAFNASAKSDGNAAGFIRLFFNIGNGTYAECGESRLHNQGDASAVMTAAFTVTIQRSEISNSTLNLLGNVYADGGGAWLATKPGSVNITFLGYKPVSP
jgi:hypothetical protein